jgi:hypothetical protein
MRTDDISPLVSYMRKQTKSELRSSAEVASESEEWGLTNSHSLLPSSLPDRTHTRTTVGALTGPRRPRAD